jgi:hypothetical protein
LIPDELHAKPALTTTSANQRSDGTRAGKHMFSIVAAQAGEGKAAGGTWAVL